MSLAGDLVFFARFPVQQFLDAAGARRSRPMEVQQQIPTEAIKLYDLYIHGEIPRREFMDRLNKFTVAGLALPALVEALMPNYAAGQQVSPTDSRIKTSYETVPSPNGNGSIKGLLARPASAGHHQAAGDPRHPREPRAQPAHRGRGAPVCGGQLHGVRARRADLGRRLSRRRRQGRPDVRQGRSRRRWAKTSTRRPCG